MTFAQNEVMITQKKKNELPYVSSTRSGKRRIYHHALFFRADKTRFKQKTCRSNITVRIESNDTLFSFNLSKRNCANSYRRKGGG